MTTVPPIDISTPMTADELIDRILEDCRDARSHGRWRSAIEDIQAKIAAHQRCGVVDQTDHNVVVCPARVRHCAETECIHRVPHKWTDTCADPCSYDVTASCERVPLAGGAQTNLFAPEL